MFYKFLYSSSFSTQVCESLQISKPCLNPYEAYIQQRKPHLSECMADRHQQKFPRPSSMYAHNLILQSPGWIQVILLKISDNAVAYFRGKMVRWNQALSRHSVSSGTEVPRVYFPSDLNSACYLLSHAKQEWGLWERSQKASFIRSGGDPFFTPKPILTLQRNLKC